MDPTESTRKGMPGRLLKLLSLLQTRREWSGSELADRLGVSDRGPCAGTSSGLRASIIPYWAPPGLPAAIG